MGRGQQTRGNSPPIKRRLVRKTVRTEPPPALARDYRGGFAFQETPAGARSTEFSAPKSMRVGIVEPSDPTDPEKPTLLTLISARGPEFWSLPPLRALGRSGDSFCFRVLEHGGLLPSPFLLELTDEWVRLEMAGRAFSIPSVHWLSAIEDWKVR